MGEDMLFRKLLAYTTAIGVFADGGAMASAAQKKSIILVHGGWVDGSGWQGVYKILTADGYDVTVVQIPTINLKQDVQLTKSAIDATPGDVVVVGHSYGGTVITEAGNDPKVKALVYVTAFALDEGESVQTAIAHPAPGDPIPPILPPKDGFLTLDKAKFPASFAGDVNPELASFMANSQVPWGLEALGEVVHDPAWKKKPTFYLVTTEDKMIPPHAQRAMAQRANATVTEAQGSHSIYISHPDVVARFIERAATSGEGQ
jgi:pimeloyl-ACP methyl ester carboxylesterase